MPDKVDYLFRNGWVDTGDLPCREALREHIAQRIVIKPSGSFDAVFIGSDDGLCDFSSFYFRPTLVRRDFAVTLRSRTGGRVEMRLKTCGGVNIWLGENHVAQHEPFTRNAPQEVDLSFDVPKGEVILSLSLEDLHERDTNCFFQLVYLGGADVSADLDAGIAGDAVTEAASVLENLRMDAVFHTGGTARLLADPPPQRPIDLQIKGLVPFGRGGISPDPDIAGDFTVTLGPDTPSCDLFKAGDAPAGCLSFMVSAKVAQVTLTRELGTTNLPAGLPLSGDLAARKTQAAAAILDDPAFDPSVAVLLAQAAQKLERMTAIITDALMTVEQRFDCSDFAILPLLRLLRDHADCLDPALHLRLRDAVLGYRYWLDEPGDDVMWFWSENHVLCFHTAQMVAGSLFPDAVFSNIGRTGRQMQAAALPRLRRWFASITQHGLCEWNSAAYYPIDLLALLILHDMVPELRVDAARLLDDIFVMTALHTSGGVPAGSQGRCYEKELLAGPMTELGSVAAIAFGGTYRTGYDRAAALFCLSDYAPPAQASSLAAAQGSDVLQARYTQGFDPDGQLSLWKAAHGQLSTVTDLNAGGQGHQAQVVDVQMAAHPMARLWINHPGETKVWGGGRPSLLAGSHVMPRVAQHGPVAMLVFDLDRSWTHLLFTQVFAAPQAFDAITQNRGWRILTSGQGHVAVWCSAPLDPVTGPYQGALHLAQATKVGWIIALSLPGETLAQFQNRLVQSATGFKEQALTLSTQGADGTALVLGFHTGLSVNGTRAEFASNITTPSVAWNDAELTNWKNL